MNKDKAYKALHLQNPKILVSLAMKSYDVTKVEVIVVIDIEKELMQAQIKHIQKELEQLRLYYDDITDLKFLQIICSYEEMLELATSMDERLLLYKKMYQDSLEYIFNEIQNTESTEDFDGIDNENSDGSRENEKLPF